MSFTGFKNYKITSFNQPVNRYKDCILPIGDPEVTSNKIYNNKLLTFVIYPEAFNN